MTVTQLQMGVVCAGCGSEGIVHQKGKCPPAQQHSKTSRDAAKQIAPQTPTLRTRVLAYIAANGPVTDEAIANGLGLNPSTARPRRIELVAEGLVRAHYETQRTASGRQATAWVVT